MKPRYAKPRYALWHSRSMGVCTSLWLLFAGALIGSVAVADQRAPELASLFTSLEQADDNSQATEIEARIWQLWLEAPDQAAAALMSQVAIAMQRAEFDLALRFCNQLLDGSPGFAEAWNKRATVHYLMGNHDASVADIRATLALEPRHFGAISGLGLIFMQRGDLEAALSAFEQVLEISPASENAKRSANQVRDGLGREI